MPRPAYNQVQETLLAASRELFLQKGIRQTEMREIASRAGVSRSTLYRYAVDKEQLAFMVAIELMFGLTEQCMAFATDQQLTGYEKLRQFTHQLAKALTEDEALVRFLSEFDSLFADRRFDEQKKADYAFVMDRLLHREAQFLFEGLADGSVAPMENPMLFTSILIHTIYGLAMHAAPMAANAPDGRSYMRRHIIDSAIEILLESVRAGR